MRGLKKHLYVAAGVKDRMQELHELQEAAMEAWTENRSKVLEAWDRATDQAHFMYDATATGHRDWLRSRLVVAEQGIFHDFLRECHAIEDVVSFFSDAEHLYQYIQEHHEGLPPARFPDQGLWGQVTNHEFWRRNWPLMPKLAMTLPRGVGTVDVLFLYRHA